MNDSKLHRIVDEAKCNPVVAAMIRSNLMPALQYLGWSLQDTSNFIEDMLLDADYSENGWEEILHSSMPAPGMTNLANRMVERADLTYGKISPHILPGTVLDLGGGSGEIGKRIAADGHDVTIADVRDWRADQSLKFVWILNNEIAARYGSFDTVVVLHVFHHSDDPEKLLKAAFRVARQRVIFIESVTDTMEEWLYTAWFDWFYNRAMHYSADPKNKIPVPCRFFPTVGWKQMVRRLDRLTPTVSQDLGIYQVLNPIHHHLYVYDK